MITPYTANAQEWDAFIASEQFRPFLQSYTMGEVYRAVGQEPVRLAVMDNGKLTGICMALLVPARRGRHLSVPYGPIVRDQESLRVLLDELHTIAKKERCSFVRLSPLWKKDTPLELSGSRPSPLHLLAEHIWYLPLTVNNTWEERTTEHTMRTEDDIRSNMRKTTRNLIGRAERDGVTVRASNDPNRDVEHFLRLHEETRKRHGFTPYTDRFFREQVKHFSTRNECTVYLAEYEREIIAASIHMHAFGETSYHHGASSQAHAKVPASYLLQWKAIQDAMSRGDTIYNFWGVSPEGATKHPFAGVRTFKTGFGGKQLDIVPCMDIPLSTYYMLTRAFETARKWRRGF